MHVQTVDFTHSTAPQVFAESLLSTGFAVVGNHPVPEQLIFDTYDDWSAFFASEEKQRYRFREDDVIQAGYFPFNVSEKAKGYDKKDLKEFYHYYEWSPTPQKIGQRTPKLFNHLLSLAKVLLEWIEAETPARIRNQLSMPLSQMIEKSRSNLFRIIHYPPLTGEEEEGAVRAAAHEDINLITLLPSAIEPGLQVKDMEGKWHDIACDPGSIVVNTGDMLQLATQNFYKATTHRVMNPQGEGAKRPRYSMPFFLHPRGDVLLTPTLTAQQYLDERLRELGLKSA